MTFDFYQLLQLMGLAVTIAAVVISNKCRGEENKKDNEELKKHMDETKTDINTSVRDHLTYIKEDLKRLEEKQDKHNGLIERMVKVEQSTKSAHNRLNELKGESHNEERN